MSHAHQPVAIQAPNSVIDNFDPLKIEVALAHQLDSIHSIMKIRLGHRSSGVSLRGPIGDPCH